MAPILSRSITISVKNRLFVGRTLHNEARWNVLEILTNVQKLVEVFIKKGCTRLVPSAWPAKCRGN